MSDRQKLLAIKIVHTIIWVFFNLVLVYLFYAVISDRIDYRFWIGIGCIVAECLVLLAFRWTCPLTYLARRYSDSPKDNFDIFLPNWLARHNKLIYSTIFAILVILYVYQTQF